MGEKPISFGEKLKRLRLRHAVTQHDLAVKFSVTRSTISNWENNRRVPSLEDVQRLAEFYDVSVQELLGGASPYRPDKDATNAPKSLQRILIQHPGFAAHVTDHLVVAIAALILLSSVWFHGLMQSFLTLSGTALLIGSSFHLIITYRKRRRFEQRNYDVPNDWVIVLRHIRDADTLKQTRFLFRALTAILWAVSLIAYGLIGLRMLRFEYDLLSIVMMFWLIPMIVLGYRQFHRVWFHLPFQRDHFLNREALNYPSFFSGLPLIFDLVTVVLLSTLMLTLGSQVHFVESVWDGLALILLSLHALATYVYHLFTIRFKLGFAWVALHEDNEYRLNSE